MNDDLFSNATAMPYQPLAARMRPRSLDEYLGQEHILAPGKPLYDALSHGALHSMIFWGPPGVGKTSLARLITASCEAEFISLSAVLSGVKEIREAVAQAKQNLSLGKKTVLFVDEAHRFSKSQQDAFLPYVEDGTVIFIGATTENPSFELNKALLSRCRIYVLKALDEAILIDLMRSAVADQERGLGRQHVTIDPQSMALIAQAANGDARQVLNLLEIAVDLAEQNADGLQVEPDIVKEVIKGGARKFDKGGDVFYEQISALHKSVRGSNPDATLYWFARMLDGGCDPLYIARRVVRMASEDIGNADPRALSVSLAAWDVQERLGSPEGELAIAQALVYLASAPKSNAVYSAFKQAMSDAATLPDYEVPVHLRNAPTSLMKALDYGADYRYAHDEPNGYAAGESYFPEALKDLSYYRPVDRGLEAKIKEKLEYLRGLDAASMQQRYQSDSSMQQE